MKNKTLLKILFLSLVLSSCGLIDKFKSPEQPTDSKESTGESEDELMSASPASEDPTDDLFAKSMDDKSSSGGSDSPSNISTDAELNSLESEFAAPNGNEMGMSEDEIANKPALTYKTAPSTPVVVEEAIPEIKPEVVQVSHSGAGEVKNYTVQRGDTLMQIAFKIYGDVSKWKEIKNMNSGKLTNNMSLKANTTLKYRAPETPFVWNPEGTPYMIKNADTLGTISNTVYGTKKKWKAIWENNKPLIKNPNVTYAGFTLYYKNGGMANFVQPRSEQPTAQNVEEVVVEKEIEKQTQIAPKKDVVTRPTPIRNEAQFVADSGNDIESEEINENEEQMDETNESLSATNRKTLQVNEALKKIERTPSDEKVLDLVNNVSVPQDGELAPDIDEEVQTLE